MANDAAVMSFKMIIKTTMTITAQSGRGRPEEARREAIPESQNLFFLLGGRKHKGLPHEVVWAARFLLSIPENAGELRKEI